MKSKILVSCIIFVAFYLSNISVMANTSYSRCKTMIDGQCIQYYEQPTNGANACRTMVEGQCIEYYYQSYQNFNNYQYTNKPKEVQQPETKFVKRPEWIEIAPLKYENPKHYKVPITNAQFDSNDWYKLKVEFENLLSACDKKTGDAKYTCYEKLRAEANYKVNNFVSTRDKWSQWSKNYQHSMTVNKLIDSSIKSNNAHTFINVPY